MHYIDHQGNKRNEDGMQDRLLAALYTTRIGRTLLKGLIRPALSRHVGAFLDSPASRCLIGPFIRANHLDMSSYEKQRPEEFGSYNEFFTRKIKTHLRPVTEDTSQLPSPCDGKVTVYPLGKDTHFTVKQSVYSVESLLHSRELAERFQGGYAVILRLCVTDYHRYSYPVSGRKSKNVRIPGVLHTVNPIAVETAGVFHENTREYTLIQTNHFGTVLQMEVGALLVGRICNHQEAGQAERGAEKGFFAFGGSTIILLLQKDKVKIRRDLLENTKAGCETEVYLGECIAEKII